MRLRELALLAVACRGDRPPPPPAPTPPARVEMPADAGPPLVELLHAVPATVKVSSQVKNAAIKPEHLVDHDLNTAWNSRTGDLEGAWIDVTLPAGATVEEVRMTAGHTGHGPKGEDYFTMNPRITGVSITHGDAVLGKYPLDPDKRELQTLKVRTTDALRIHIDRVKLGSNKTWREACVSELEVWGTLPPGVQAQALTPVVEVAPPPPPPSEFTKLCAGIEEAKQRAEERIRAMQDECTKDPTTCPGDFAGPPDCHVAIVDITNRAPPWREVAVHTDMTDTNFHLGSIDILVRVNDEVITADSIELDGTPFDFGDIDASIEHGALVLRYDTENARKVTHHQITCRATPTPTCQAKQ